MKPVNFKSPCEILSDNFFNLIDNMSQDVEDKVDEYTWNILDFYTSYRVPLYDECKNMLKF